MGRRRSEAVNVPPARRRRLAALGFIAVLAVEGQALRYTPSNMI